MIIKDYIHILQDYKKAYKNYFSVLFQLYIKRKETYQNDKIMIKAVLKDGKRLYVPYGWIVNFAQLHRYQNKNISNLTLTEKGILFNYKTSL